MIGLVVLYSFSFCLSEKFLISFHLKWQPCGVEAPRTLLPENTGAEEDAPPAARPLPGPGRGDASPLGVRQAVSPHLFHPLLAACHQPRASWICPREPSLSACPAPQGVSLAGSAWWSLCALPSTPLAAPSSKAPRVPADLPASGGLPEYRKLSPFTAPSPVQVLAQFLFFNPPFVLPGFVQIFLPILGALRSSASVR